MRNVQVLFRKDLDSKNEYDSCKKYLPTTPYRSFCDSLLVIGRYSVLPFYKELEDELIAKSCNLINSFEQYQWISDIRNWSDLINTPKTYTRWDNLPSNKSFIIKGITNSRKHNWNTSMFASDSKDVRRVIDNLMLDSLLADQPLVIREYVPLKTFGYGINGLPITNEYRCFFLRNRDGNIKSITSDFYWSGYPEYNPKEVLPKKALGLLDQTVKLIGTNSNFYTIDIAETVTGDWIVIELNEGQMSGLANADPNYFYWKMKQILEGYI